MTPRYPLAAQPMLGLLDDGGPPPGMTYQEKVAWSWGPGTCNRRPRWPTIGGSGPGKARRGDERMKMHEDTDSGFAGADWVRANYNCEMSDLGRQVADLLGDLYEGIYHLDNSATKKADWSNEYVIIITLRTQMGTVDNNLLTRLVVLCHDRMIRCQLEGSGPGYMRAMFHQRKLREGHQWERCPTMENHVSQIRAHYRVIP